jgi:hypothetical protein
MKNRRWGNGDRPAPRPPCCHTNPRILGLRHVEATQFGFGGANFQRERRRRRPSARAKDWQSIRQPLDEMPLGGAELSDVKDSNRCETVVGWRLDGEVDFRSLELPAGDVRPDDAVAPGEGELAVTVCQSMVRDERIDELMRVLLGLLDELKDVPGALRQGFPGLLVGGSDRLARPGSQQVGDA